jgi:putative addiction module component (TIGR02574 family)
MSMPQEQLFENALSLPQSQRADLAFQLLLSLEPPGELVDTEKFGAELHNRVESYRRGTTESLSLEEARAVIRQRLAEGPVQ